MKMPLTSLISIIAALCLLACLAAGYARPQADAPPLNLTVINDSDAEVFSISVFYAHDGGETGPSGFETCVGQNADNSPLGKGESLSFECPEADGLSVRVSAYGGVGQTLGDPIAEASFTLDLAESKAVSLAIREGADGALRIELADAPA